MNLGQIIRDFRKQRNITLAALAKKLEISVSYLSAIERNIRKPSVKMLKKISDNLNVPINYLLGAEGDVLTGNKLKYMRESRDLSLEDLSEICDIPVIMLEKFEDGQEIPDLEYIKKLSEGLNVTIKYFLDRSDNRNYLGNRVKRLRMDRGLTIVSLADKVSVTPGFVSQIENGLANPQLETLEAIAKALNTSASYLLMESSDVEDLLATISPDLLDILGDPNVQAVLRSLRDFQTNEIKFIINYVQFYKQNKSQL
jgi:transcriptional regulator with XRE-family HTH domain